MCRPRSGYNRTGGESNNVFAILMLVIDNSDHLSKQGFPIYESAINFSGAKLFNVFERENSFSFNADEVLSLINSNTDY